jgi:hypothetical protein
MERRVRGSRARTLAFQASDALFCSGSVPRLSSGGVYPVVHRVLAGGRDRTVSNFDLWSTKNQEQRQAGRGRTVFLAVSLARHRKFGLDARGRGRGMVFPARSQLGENRPSRRRTVNYAWAQLSSRTVNYAWAARHGVLYCLSGRVL